MKTQKIKKFYQKKRAKEYQIKGLYDPAQRAFNNLFTRGITVDCNLKEFKQQMESKFIFGEIGWFNYGSWEVDHIFPISKGGTNELSNLQPLLKEENRKKFNKVATATLAC